MDLPARPGPRVCETPRRANHKTCPSCLADKPAAADVSKLPGSGSRGTSPSLHRDIRNDTSQAGARRPPPRATCNASALVTRDLLTPALLRADSPYRSAGVCWWPSRPWFPGPRPPPGNRGRPSGYDAGANPRPEGRFHPRPRRTRPGHRSRWRRGRRSGRARSARRSGRSRRDHDDGEADRGRAGPGDGQAQVAAMVPARRSPGGDRR